MLTPIEIQSTVLKSGMGYSKKDTDTFLSAIVKDYEALYKENVELKDKLSVLSEGIQYYKNMETTLQKALVLAEKTSEETQATAVKKASAIEKEADARAKLLLADAKNELGKIQTKTILLMQDYEKFKAQFKRLAQSQIDLLEGETFRMNLEETTQPELTNMDSKSVDSIKDQPQEELKLNSLEVEANNENSETVKETMVVDTENDQIASETYDKMDDFEFLED